MANIVESEKEIEKKIASEILSLIPVELQWPLWNALKQCSIEDWPVDATFKNQFKFFQGFCNAAVYVSYFKRNLIENRISKKQIEEIVDKFCVLVKDSSLMTSLAKNTAFQLLFWHNEYENNHNFVTCEICPRLFRIVSPCSKQVYVKRQLSVLRICRKLESVRKTLQAVIHSSTGKITPCFPTISTV